MIYAIIALISTTLGSLVGIGGGMIIRPLLAFMEIDKGLASFTSAITVFSMAIVNLLIHKRNKTPIDIKGNVFMATGSIIGGFAGGSLLALASTLFVNIGFIVALALVLFVVMFREKLPQIKIKNPVLAVLIGLCTGLMSGFFGIGGGPFQMAALVSFFGYKPKDAAVQSILITLMTTASSLVSYSLNGNVGFSLAVFMIPAAIIGGYAGAQLNRKFSHSRIALVFNVTVAAIICLQLYTIIFR